MLLFVMWQKRGVFCVYKDLGQTNRKQQQQQQEITGVDKDVEKRETSPTVGGNVNWHSHYRKVWTVLKKLTIAIPYDTGIPLLGIYIKKMKSPILEDNAPLCLLQEHYF